MQNPHFPSPLEKACRASYLSLLGLAQWIVLRTFFSGDLVFDEATTLPILLMIAFHLTGFALAFVPPSRTGKVAFVWGCLFAANLGYAIALVPVMMRPSSCVSQTLLDALILVIPLYSPVFLARLFLTRSVPNRA